MTLQDWGAIGELVGGVAIIVSLIYVGLQIRQGTSAARAATNQAFSEQYTALLLTLTRTDVSEVYWKGMPGLENLQGNEMAMYSGFLASIFRTYETFYFEKCEGRFDSKMWEGYTSLFADLMSHRGPREYWELRKHQYSEEFGEVVESEVLQRNSRPLYPPAFDATTTDEQDA